MVELLNSKDNARKFDLYRHRNWWHADQTVEFDFQPNGLPHKVRVRGKLLGFIGGEFFGDGQAYAFVEVEDQYQYRLLACELIKR